MIILESFKVILDRIEEGIAILLVRDEETIKPTLGRSTLNFDEFY